ncbi:hypothetical protein JCM12141A_03820 [Mycolicibacterium hodleri]
MGTYPANGALTLVTSSDCGHCSVTSSLITGNNGTPMAKAIPSRPAMTAISRVGRENSVDGTVLVGSVNPFTSETTAQLPHAT